MRRRKIADNLLVFFIVILQSIYSDLDLHGLVQETSTCSISEKLDLEAMVIIIFTSQWENDYTKQHQVDAVN